MPVVHQFQAFALVAHVLLYHLQFGVELAQGEIVGGQLCGEHQPCVLKVGGCGLERGVRRFQLMAHVAEQVGLVADVERKREDILGESRGNRRAVQWTIRSCALAQGGGIGGETREQS